MDAVTTRKRIPAHERRQSILAAARKLFAERGFEGAKTSHIAAGAGVSEALLYRHFASKEALYRAVLRDMVREQNRMYDMLGLPEPNTASLVIVIREYMRSSIATGHGALREGLRIMLASLGADGTYAGLLYRRAMRLQLAPIEAALAQAQAAGDMAGTPLAGENAAMFVEHVGTMLAATRGLPTRFSLHKGDTGRLVEEATLFCCRGIGLSEEATRRHLAGDPSRVGRADRRKKGA